VNNLIFQRKIEEAERNKLVNVEFTTLTLMAKCNPEISLVVWTGSQLSVVLRVNYAAVVANRIIWVLGDDYPFFLL
jgi:hypothetical protein